MTQLADQFAQTGDAWRLEARDIYEVPEYGPALEAWRIGAPAPDRADGWLDLVREVRSRGATIGRVRIVGRPLNDYTRWEFTQYAENVAAGEDVRLVERADVSDLPRTDTDVWLFDNATAFVQQYTEAGEYLGADEVAAGPFVDLRQRLESLAVPFADYQADAN